MTQQYLYGFGNASSNTHAFGDRAAAAVKVAAGQVAWVRDQLAIATGSACSAGVEAPSHVLQAIGLSRAEQAGSLRLSLGKWTTPAEVQAAGNILLSALAELR